MKKKSLVLIAAIAVVMSFAVGGTLAWLVDRTDPVTNTFTYGDINITLSESAGLDLKMIPGNRITKDPKVTVRADSEACWLFVKIEQSANYSDYLENYVVADGWTALTGTAGVYYREVAATTTDVEFPVLMDNQVSVKTTVTKEMMQAIKDAAVSAPTLTFTAYAVQKDNFADPAMAWAEASR